MSTATYVDKDGKTTGQVDLPGDIFDIAPNVPVMHAVVKAHLAAIRAGTHSTKTRAEVRGGGKKPWRQKGTGRARHGSTREPQWVGGGVAHGPKPRDYSFSLTKKTRALALRCALSDRAREGSIIVVDLPIFDAPKTKRAKALLESWGATGKVLLITGSPPPDSGDTHLDTWKSFRNLTNVLMVQGPTTYRVLAADVVVLTREALAQITKTEALPEPHPADRVPELEPSRAQVAAVVHAAIDAVVEAELQDEVVAALLPEVEAQAEALTGEEEGAQ